MGARLPPGEADRRRLERAKAMFSGAKYNKVKPGNPDDWASLARSAAAFITGDPSFLNDAHAYVPPEFRAKPSSNPWLAALFIDDMPADARALTAAYRAATMRIFKANDYRDTAPGFVSAFAEITKAYDRLKGMRGW